MSNPIEASCRVFALLARDGRSAVIFRRGPTRRVQLLRWWLADDRIEEGQWFNGRIYEYRCDLSPDGELLIYFAASWKGPYQSWTAISRPPYLTALALWPKGDAWGGGGVFMDATTIGLNHGATSGAIDPSHKARWHPLGAENTNVIPKPFTVVRWSAYAGGGEDNPLHHHRITRDGWRLLEAGDEGPHSSGEFGWHFRKPEVYERVSPVGGVRLRRVLKAIYQKNGPWYVQDFELWRDDGQRLRLLSGCSWADFDRNGDVVFALSGSLFRLSVRFAPSVSDDPRRDTKLIADLSLLKPQLRKAPEWATRWS